MKNNNKEVNIKLKELLKLVDVAEKRINEGLTHPGMEWDAINEFLFTLKAEDITDFALLCLTGETYE